MKHEQHEDFTQDSSLAEAELAKAELTKAELAGWDPFQIWRTRVREPQLQAQVTPPLKKTA